MSSNLVAARIVNSIMAKTIGRFHVLTDYHFQQRFSHAELAQQAIRGGADSVQFRQKSGGIRHILTEAQRAAETCREHATPFLVNDRIDVALACQASGVHLGQTDFPLSAARRILGDDAVIGATASTLEQALQAQDEGADYVGFGPIFETRSKRNPAAARGLQQLAKVCAALHVPVIAIAGITARRVEDVIRAGAYGVAVMTAVTTAAFPASAARDIRQAVDDALGVSAAASATNGQRQGAR